MSDPNLALQGPVSGPAGLASHSAVSPFPRTSLAVSPGIPHRTGPGVSPLLKASVLSRRHGLRSGTSRAVGTLSETAAGRDPLKRGDGSLLPGVPATSVAATMGAASSVHLNKMQNRAGECGAQRLSVPEFSVAHWLSPASSPPKDSSPGILTPHLYLQ